MTFDEYQSKTPLTAKYPTEKSMGILYTSMGLSGEVGEICNKVKKIIRDDNFIVTDDKRNDIKKEIGDVLWYVSQLCNELGLNMDEIAFTNLEKLRSRNERGVIGGSGDNR